MALYAAAVSVLFVLTSADPQLDRRRYAPIIPSAGVSNVVFSLIRSSENTSTFAERTKCLSRVLAGGAKFDHVAFYEEEPSPVTVGSLKLQSPDLRLVDARAFGGFVASSAEAKLASQGSQTHPLGYRLM
eukprot:7332662-Prymnesium_polylepis.2